MSQRVQNALKDFGRMRVASDTVGCLLLPGKPSVDRHPPCCVALAPHAVRKVHTDNFSVRMGYLGKQEQCSTVRRSQFKQSPRLQFGKLIKQANDFAAKLKRPDDPATKARSVT